jgi:transcriptional repressor NrdR
VEQELARRPDREVATSDIGSMALHELQALDHVAYLRFASVYHAVTSPEDFLEVLRPLLERS